MKREGILLIIALLLSGVSLEAQILKKLKKRVKDAAEEAVIRKTEEKVSEKTGKAMDTLLNPKIGKKQKKKKGKKGTSQKPNNEDIEVPENGSSNEELQLWSKYNFVPGDEIIFYDDLADEESGEFPSRWDLLNGNAENASLGDENIINIKNKTLITPLMDEADYLPEVFTIEFDAYFDDKVIPSYHNYYIRLWAGNDQRIYFGENKKDYYFPIKASVRRVEFKGRVNGQEKKYENNNDDLIIEGGGWHHIAIAYNKRSLKMFVDQYRVLNIPNLVFKPTSFSISAYTSFDPEEKHIKAIKNIRIAEGGKKLYDRVIADGKFVARGILFDVNQATLKPESMGVINQVAKMMQKHEDLNFNIEGHTDSDGEDEYNLELSARRAEAVKTALVVLGISEERLQTEGKGESVPVAENTSPEGKANNRRVEFIKL